jgi:hypothetical protein
VEATGRVVHDPIREKLRERQTRIGVKHRGMLGLQPARILAADFPRGPGALKMHADSDKPSTAAHRYIKLQTQSRRAVVT